METRKRSHSVEDDKIVLKKHIVSDENGSPRVNGVSEGQNEEIDPAADDGLEVFFRYFSVPSDSLVPLALSQGSHLSTDAALFTSE